MKPSAIDLLKAVLWLENQGKSEIPDQIYSVIKDFLAQKEPGDRGLLYKLGKPIFESLQLATPTPLKPAVQPLYERCQYDFDLGDRAKMVGAPDIECVVTAILVRRGGHVNYELTWVHEGEVKTGWLTVDSIEGKKKKEPIGFQQGGKA